MTSRPDRIAEMGVATVRAALPEPIRFGDWEIAHREYVVVRALAESGAEGFAFTLTREGPVAAAARQAVVAHYVGRSYERPEELFEAAQRSNLASLASGIGLRALSVVDLATWDLKGRAAGVSIARLLGGEPRPLPATAIVGYPPSIDGDRTAAQVSELHERGWRRFKLPVSGSEDLTRERLHAAASVAEDIWVGADAAWTFREVEDAVRFLDSLDFELGWFEDVFPPGDAARVAELRRRTEVPIAMGDEQGGSYFPQALLASDAVDVVRLDLTCAGGISRARPTIDAVEAAGAVVSPHMSAHVHSQVLAGLDCEAPIEWGVPGTGVDPFADTLRQPTVSEGLMEPLPELPGFGPLVNPDWLAEQDVDDHDGVIHSLA